MNTVTVYTLCHLCTFISVTVNKLLQVKQKMNNPVCLSTHTSLTSTDQIFIQPDQIFD